MTKLVALAAILFTANEKSVPANALSSMTNGQNQAVDRDNRVAI
jgi:hypothetical protein